MFISHKEGRFECRLDSNFQPALFNLKLVKYVVGTKGNGPVQCTYNPHSTDVSGNEMETSFSTFKPAPEMVAANDPVQCTYHPHSTDVSGNEMERGFSTFKPQPKIATANQLYDSTYRPTGLPGYSGAASHPLCESTFTVTEQIGKVNKAPNGDRRRGRED